MDEKQNAAQEWLETATKGIRFGPDRLAVEAELREHLEDKTADMARMKEKWKTWRKRLKERREDKKTGLSDLGSPAFHRMGIKNFLAKR